MENLFYTFLLRLRLGKWYKNRLASKIINTCKNVEYDYILSLEIKQPEAFYQKLHTLQPKARFVLYYWDSIKFFNYLPYIKYFDKVFSFDKDDAEANDSVIYLPLFYIDSYAAIRTNDVSEKKYDLLFIASYNEERYHNLERFLEELPQNVKIYIYLRATLGIYIKCALKGLKMKWFGIRKMTQSEIANMYRQCNCVLDFDKKSQSGLTMRTIESLGAGKKIVTSNKRIKEELFFNQNNIFILGDNNPKALEDFVKKDFVSSPRIEDYSIEKWCLKLFANNVSGELV